MARVRRKKKQKFLNSPIVRRTLKVFALLTSAGILTFIIFFLSVKYGAFGPLPDKAVLKKIENNVATEIYSEDQVLLGRYYLQERTTTKYNDISKHVIEALIATEDARFYEHEGIDYRSLARVFFKTFLLLDRSSGGGSTISQQLAKNLFARKDHGWLSIPVSKVREAIVAQRLEDIYSKEEILTLYLNTVPFGDNVFGIEMAAKRFFNKKAKNLRLEEAAVLVGMLKANYTYNPRLYPENALSRRNTVLHQMVRYNYLQEDTYDSLQLLPLQLDYVKITHNSGTATYFREHLRQELEAWCEENTKPDGSAYNLYTDGLKIYTTINSKLQKYAEQAMHDHMANLQGLFYNHWANTSPWDSNKEILLQAIKKSGRYKRLKDKGLSESEVLTTLHKPVPMKIFKWSGEQEVEMSPIDSIKHHLKILQTGILAMDPKNGDIKAWVGGINYEHFKFDHVNTNTKRQVGSTFKPLVYAAALENGSDPCKYISGEKITYTNLANWSPGNADESEYDKKYTYKGALAHSVNTVSVRVLEDVGIARTIALANQAGIRSDLPQLPSIALGTADISLMEMVTAYCMFANGGYAVSPRYITAIADHRGETIVTFDDNQKKERVLSSENAIIMNSLLQAVVNEGTAGRYRWKYGLKNQLAGKTGTTQANADGWFIGYNPAIVVGTWVGADNPSIRFRTTDLGSGANTALPIVAHLFKKMQNDPEVKVYGTATFPPVPDHIQRMLDCQAEKEDKQFMEWLFGDKKEKEKKERFDEKGGGKKSEKKNIFDKIGGFFKKKKKKKD